MNTILQLSKLEPGHYTHLIPSNSLLYVCCYLLVNEDSKCKKNCRYYSAALYHQAYEHANTYIPRHMLTDHFGHLD